MNKWRDAWVIIKKELSTDRVYLIWGPLFMAYAGAMIGLMMYGRSEQKDHLNPVIDFLMLTVLSLAGILFSRRSFNYIKDDTYTRMLFYYRTMPIPVETVMKSRFLHMIAAFLFNGVILFTAIRLIFDMNMNGLQYAVFILTWLGYAIAVNGIFIFFEFTTSGRTYMWISILLVLLFGLTAAISAISGFGLTEYSMQMSIEHGMLSPLMWGTLLGGVLLLAGFSTLAIRKLSRRSLRG